MGFFDFFKKREKTIQSSIENRKALLPPLMGKARAAEKIRVHYGGDASRLLDISRCALVFQSIDDLYIALDDLKTNQEVVRFIDRIVEPTEMGYGDITLNLRMKNGHISTMRLLLEPILKAKSQAHALYAKKHSILGAAQQRNKAETSIVKNYAVVVLDMFNYMEKDGAMLVGGFPTQELAKEYVQRRMRDSVEELRTDDLSREELKELWLVFGEDSILIANQKEQVYHGFADLDSFIEQSWSKTERDWVDLENRFPVYTEPLLF